MFNRFATPCQHLKDTDATGFLKSGNQMLRDIS
jgi:hypothetical protein